MHRATSYSKWMFARERRRHGQARTASLVAGSEETPLIGKIPPPRSGSGTLCDVLLQKGVESGSYDAYVWGE